MIWLLFCYHRKGLWYQVSIPEESLAVAFSYGTS